jgi:hypothetical protein
MNKTLEKIFFFLNNPDLLSPPPNTPTPLASMRVKWKGLWPFLLLLFLSHAIEEEADDPAIVNFLIVNISAGFTLNPFVWNTTGRGALSSLTSCPLSRNQNHCHAA